MIESRLTEIYEGIFKNSKIAITKNSFSGDNVLWVQLYLAQNEQEEINGYFDNDMFDIMFKITKTAEDNYIMENRQNRYLVKPTNKYLVYEGKKVAFRKTQGNEDKIITTFKKYVGNLHNALVEDLKQDLQELCDIDKGEITPKSLILKLEEEGEKVDFNPLLIPQIEIV